jgi:hypothetical protein
MDTQQLQDEIQKLWSTINQLQSAPAIPDHFHNGYDVSPINFSMIYQKKVYIHHTLQGANAATASNYGTFWIAPFACLAKSVSEIHQTAGTDGGTVSLQVEKLTGTTAAGAGSNIMGTAYNLKNTANTLQSFALVTTAASITLAKGDRLALKLSGTPTSLSTVSVMTELQII